MTKKAMITIAIAAIVVMGAAIGIWAWVSRGGNVTETLQQIGILPEAEEQARPFAGEEAPEGEAPPVVVVTPPPAGTTAEPLPDARDSLAVVIDWQTEPAFQVSIAEVTKTYEVPNIDDFTPREGELFSVLALVTEQGVVASRHSFSIPTEFIFEQFPINEQDPHASENLTSGRLDLVVPITAPPVQVRIETPQEQVITERTFDYDALPVDVPAPQRAISFLPRVFADLLRPFMARAQEQATLTIVATNQPGGNSREVAEAARDMISSLEPWASYAARGHVRVVNLPNAGEDLGCGFGLVRVAGGRRLPGCPNPGKVKRFVSRNGIDADLIGVSISAPCRECGATVFRSLISGVGLGLTPQLLGHELAHAFRTPLYDEYLWELNVTGSNLLPNCLPSEAACRAAIAGTGGSCHLGCNSTTSWRTVDSGLMRRSANTYGPYDTCVINQNIAGMLGIAPFDCGGPDRVDLDTYWGWFR